MSDPVTKPSSEEMKASNLTKSERHRLLAKERRRVTMRCLARLTPAVTLSELSLAVAECEADVGIASEETRERMAITLHHCDLPLMADFGVLTYDANARRVERLLINPDALFQDEY